MSPPSAILLAALVTEGLIIIVAYIIVGLCDVPLVWNGSFEMIGLGLLYTVPLLVLNHLLFAWSIRNPDTVYGRFSREVVQPLCKQVTPPLALTLALLSGFGEELFFRGAFNSLLIGFITADIPIWIQMAGVAVITSFLFAYVHFIGQLHRFGGLLPLYTAVGLYLWGLVMTYDSLALVCVTHGAYNFIVMVTLRRRVLRGLALR